MQDRRFVGHTMLLHAEGEKGGGGLTVVGVQQGQGALSAPIHPSLRDNQRKKLDGEEVTARKEKCQNCEVLKAAKVQFGKISGRN